jgi:ParB family chromosome partitioning protein
MELEIAALDLRYESLRSRSAARERRLLAAIGSSGQQVPIVVVGARPGCIVVDGYKRVRVLRRLGEDTVRALPWELSEADALVLEQAMREGGGSSALEQGWLLVELETRFGLGRAELARRFDRTPSWVSRRMGLVRELPASVHGHVRTGALGAHGAMKHLVPLARANTTDCVRLSDAVAKLRPTSRQLAELCATYASGNAKTRELVVSRPELVLKAKAEALAVTGPEPTPAVALGHDARTVAAIARRACARLAGGALDGASEGERDEVGRAMGQARAEVDGLLARWAKETSHAR